jgi:hypothetical protein
VDKAVDIYGLNVLRRVVNLLGNAVTPHERGVKVHLIPHDIAADAGCFGNAGDAGKPLLNREVLQGAEIGRFIAGSWAVLIFITMTDLLSF